MAVLAAAMLATLHAGFLFEGSSDPILRKGPLLWTASDNGVEADFKQAAQYCEGLSLAGYSDWRLPTIDELEGIYDSSNAVAVWRRIDLGNSYPVRMQAGFQPHFVWYWSGTSQGGERAWIFDFFTGRRGAFRQDFRLGSGGLCVRSVKE